MPHKNWILLAAALPALASAQFKVVDADGRVTYTDRPPTTGGAKVTELRRTPVAPETAGVAGLPAELRQVVQRYPVVLYTAADCSPCELGRQLLQQRGVPFAERRLTSDAEIQAAERALGWRTMPSLTVGAQSLRGFTAEDWVAYLDAAGYPKESRLPRNWQPAPAVAAQAPGSPPAAAARPARAPAGDGGSAPD